MNAHTQATITPAEICAKPFKYRKHVTAAMEEIIAEDMARARRFEIWGASGQPPSPQARSGRTAVQAMADAKRRMRSASEQAFISALSDTPQTAAEVAAKTGRAIGHTRNMLCYLGVHGRAVGTELRRGTWRGKVWTAVKP